MSFPRRSVCGSAFAVILLVVGCIPTPTLPEWSPLPEPAVEDVEAVVFLVGDAGEAFPGASPLLSRLGREVELWSGRIAREGAVSVLFLGDVVYPVGVRPRGSPEFPVDSLHVKAQVDVLGGAEAVRHASTGFFLAGNHDWGQDAGLPGLRRVDNLENLLASFREDGYPVVLVPEAGAPGPTVRDVGEQVRFLFLDTHWWLQAVEDPREDSVLLATAEALRGAGGRDVVVAAHHPYLSGGSHGGPMPFWEGLGILYLLRRSGTLIQDINSVPYRRLLLGLQTVFAEEGAPLIWAGGHDHSLQVLDPKRESEPEWALVSGSGSKLTDVVQVPNLLYGDDLPGFMRLTWLRDGSVLLHVYAADDIHQHCGYEAGERAADAPPEDDCMTRGIEAYEVVYALELK